MSLRGGRALFRFHSPQFRCKCQTPNALSWVLRGPKRSAQFFYLISASLDPEILGLNFQISPKKSESTQFCDQGKRHFEDQKMSKNRFLKKSPNFHRCHGCLRTDLPVLFHPQKALENSFVFTQKIEKNGSKFDFFGLRPQKPKMSIFRLVFAIF